MDVIIKNKYIKTIEQYKHNTSVIIETIQFDFLDHFMKQKSVLFVLTVLCKITLINT